MNDGINITRSIEVLDLSGYTPVALDYADKLYYLHSGFALQELVKAVTTGELNVSLDFEKDGVMDTKDILKAMGYYTEGITQSFGGSMEVQGTFSNSRQIAVDTLTIFENGESQIFNTPGFAFQWASWQDEEQVMNWEAVNTFRLVIPLLDSPVSPTAEIHYIKNT